MTTTQLSAIAEAKERITDAILNGAYHGHFIDMCVKGEWTVAEMHAKGLNDAALDEIKAHTAAEIAKYRGTLDKVLSKEAILACRRFLSSTPFGGDHAEAVRRFAFHPYRRDDEPLTLGQFIEALQIIRDRTKAALEDSQQREAAHRQLQADVAAMRRVLGMTPEAK